MTFGAALLSLGFACSATVSADSFDDQISAKQVTISQANSSINALNATIATLTNTASSSTTELTTINDKLKDLGTTLSTEQAKLDSLQAAIKVQPATTDVVKADSVIPVTTTLTTESATSLATADATTEKDSTEKNSTAIVDEQAAIANYEKQIAELQGQLAALNTGLGQGTTAITNAKAKIASAQTTISQATAAITQLQADQATYNSTQGLRARLVAAAYAELGKPYVWGAQGPDSFDCSGLMNYLYTNVANMSIGSWTVPQESSGTQIAISDAQPGDLLFYGSQGATYHVAMYIGNGQYIHAPQTGDVVKVSSLASNPPSFAVSVLG